MSFHDLFEKQLVDAYDKSARHFTQLLNATTIFALAFLAFILVPLVALQREDARIGEQLRTAQAEIERAKEDEAKLTAAQALSAELTAQRSALWQQREVIEDQSAALSNSIDGIEQALQKLTQERGLLDQQRASFDQIRDVAEDLRPLDVDAFVRELQDFLRNASDVIWGQAPLESLGLAVDCPAAASDERANCVIRTKVMQMLTMTEEDLRARIITPVARVDAETARAMESRLTEAHEAFGRVLDEQPGFWQAVVLKRDVGQEFAEEIARLSGDINNAIRSKIEAMVGQATRLNEAEASLLEKGRALTADIARLQEAQATSDRKAEEIAREIATAEAELAELPQKIKQLTERVAANTDMIAKLTEDQKKIAENRQAISDRMKGVQSPFGALPIGLTEAVQVFPIIVAAGLIMTLFTLAGAMRLRSRYHQLLRRKYPDTAAEVDDGIVLTAPLFLDPYREVRANVWRAGVLFLLLAVYGLSVALIAESQRLVPQPAGAHRVIENGYVWIYIALALLLVVPLSQLAGEWRRYEPARPRRRAAAQAQPTPSRVERDAVASVPQAAAR